MQDYKRAFEILQDKSDIYTMEVDGHLMIEANKHSKEITSEEATIIENCINACLNAEEDSIEKIVEEFKKLGYVKGFWFINDDFKSYSFEYPDEDYCITIDIDLINKKFKVISHTFGNEALAIYIKPDEWRLINRILRLCGIEV